MPEPTTIRFIIDRFEDNGWAVLEREDRSIMNVQADWLPLTLGRVTCLRLRS